MHELVKMLEEMHARLPEPEWQPCEEREIGYTEKPLPTDQAMIDAGHKHEDF